MAAPITGEGGKVRFGDLPTEVDNVRQFSLTRTAEGKAYTEGGQTYRLAGNEDWNGSFSVWADEGSLSPPFAVGDIVDLDLLAHSGQVCEGEALISEVTAEVDVAGAEIVGWQATFEGSGALTIT